MILNMLTTATMVRLGKVYQNLMVDVQASCDKLSERARRIVMEAGQVDYSAAGDLLESADGQVKTAIVMALTRLDADGARKLLAHSQGSVRDAVQSTTKPSCGTAEPDA